MPILRLLNRGRERPKESANTSRRVALKKLPLADADITEAAEWYDDQQPGVGEEFLAEVDAVIRSLPKHPRRHAVRFADVRCARLKRFQRHGVLYFLWQNEIVVFSVFHGSRNPELLRASRARLD